MLTSSEFLDSLDIANKAAQHLGVRRIENVNENSKVNLEISSSYGKLRQVELRRNVWRFARRICFMRPIEDDTRIISPHPWDEDTLYLPGSIVTHTNGTIWISLATDNQGNEPGVSVVWEHYFGPSVVFEYDDTTTYGPGELVYVQDADHPGAFTVYLSTKAANDSAPNTATDWDETVTYKTNDRVLHSGLLWRSLIDVNTNNTPQPIPNTWNENVEYFDGDEAVAMDGFIWQALGTTTGNNPVIDDGTNWVNTNVPAAWDFLPTLPTGAKDWYPLYCGLESLDLEYLNIKSYSLGDNIYRLPAGWLRTARPDGKFVLPANDYVMYGDYIKTNSTEFALEFVADVTDVRKFDPLFCEGLACRIASDCAEVLTGSNRVEGNMAKRYSTFMGEARIVNAIETGIEEPEEDELIAVRRRGV